MIVIADGLAANDLHGPDNLPNDTKLRGRLICTKALPLLFRRRPPRGVQVHALFDRLDRTGTSCVPKPALENQLSIRLLNAERSLNSSHVAMCSLKDMAA